MSDHTAHIEECRQERTDAAIAWNMAPNNRAARLRYERAEESLKRAYLHRYGVPCPVEACEDGHIVTDEIPATRTSPAEPVSEDCDYCEGRGIVLPARADAYQGE